MAMKRVITAGLVGWLMIHGAVSAVGSPLQLGGWLGPHLFSDNSRLGQRDISTPATLTSALAFGARVGLPLRNGRLVPEFELAMALTQTDPFAVGVLWFEPRVLLRYSFGTSGPVRPFALIGGGAPVVLSGNSDVFANQVLGQAMIGAGIAIWTGKGFALRLDARLSLVPGDDPKVAVEGELGVGVVIPLGRSPRPVAALARARQTEVADRDGDGIADRLDGCPGRAEDVDGFEDTDGCPDIDNDLDGVLDIADTCTLQSETYNGVTDEDGCPDTVSPELADIVGVISSLVYPPDSSTPTRSKDSGAAFDRIAKALQANPSVRIRLLGHTDDREAQARAAAPVDPAPAAPADAEAPALDPAAVAVALGLARAEVVRELLVSRGIDPARIEVQSRGAEDPALDNATPTGRQANRRVELQLFVPDR